MTLIEEKLIEAYSILVMANIYILNELDRTNESQKIVPEKYTSDVEVKVAEKVVNILE